MHPNKHLSSCVPHLKYHTLDSIKLRYLVSEAVCLYVAVLQMFVKLSVEVVVAVSPKDLVIACRNRPLDWLSERILF